GDALLDPLTVAASLAGPIHLPSADVARLADARRRLFALSGKPKAAAARTLQRAEAELTGQLLAGALLDLERRIGSLLQLGRERDLFGTRRGLVAAERATLQRLRATRSELRGAARRLAREGGAPFFHFAAHFGDVLAAGGFDLVIGNPPWVRGERVPARVRETLALRYATWRVPGGSGFGHLPDLAVAFCE